MIKFHSVSYVKLAQGFSSSAEHESSLRRVQRFFAEFSFDYGKTDINILMLSICYKGVSIPLVWKLLPKRGNSNANDRKEVLDNDIRFFGIKTIKVFMADREFIGEEWFEDLIRQNIPFYIRIRNNMKIHRPGQLKPLGCLVTSKQERINIAVSCITLAKI